MHCSTSLTQLPLLPRLPRGLVSFLILSLLLHTLPLLTFQPVGILPSFTITLDRWRSLGACAHVVAEPHDTPTSAWRLMSSLLPRLMRATDLARALVARSVAGRRRVPLTWSVLIIPVVQSAH